MSALLNTQSPTEQLEGELYKQITSGRMKPGDKILPERELAKKYNLSCGSVRKVLASLVEKGLLHRDGRRGTRVCAPKANLKTISFNFFSSLDFSSMASNPYFNDIYKGMEQEAGGMGWELALQIGSALKERLAVLKTSRHHWADGIILAGADIPSVIPDLLKISFPFVVVDYPNKIQGINSIYPDNVNGGYLAVSHLRELGHKKIGFIYPLFDAETEMQEGFKARFFGYLDAMNCIKGNFDNKLAAGIRMGTDYKLLPEGETAIRQYLAALERPTAVFVSSDSIMPEFYRIARELELRIPEDVSVVGFEGLTLAERLDPPLTTVWVDREMMGRLAVQRLKSMLEGATVPLSQVLPVELIKRDSARKLEPGTNNRRNTAKTPESCLVL